MDRSGMIQANRRLGWMLATILALLYALAIMGVLGLN